MDVAFVILIEVVSFVTQNQTVGFIIPEALPNWILQTNFWSDLGVWEDTAVWND